MKFRRSRRKTPVLESIGLQLYLKRDPDTGLFLLFSKFWETAFCIEHLRWLLLNCASKNNPFWSLEATVLRMFCKIGTPKNFPENTCAGVSFLGNSLQLYSKETCFLWILRNFRKNFFREYLRTASSGSLYFECVHVNKNNLSTNTFTKEILLKHQTIFMDHVHFLVKARKNQLTWTFKFN